VYLSRLATAVLPRSDRAVGDVTERLLTARELAELLGLSPGTVLDWHEAGRIPSFKLGPGVGGPVRFRASEVEAWLEECRRGPASQRAHLMA
jgi:excisionase family DNA binding protein